MHTSKRISLLKRCCSLCSREYYKNYTEFMIHKSSIEDVVKNFLHKLYATKAIENRLVIKLTPLFYSPIISGKPHYIYRGLNVIAEEFQPGKNRFIKLVEFDLIINPQYTEQMGIN